MTKGSRASQSAFPRREHLIIQTLTPSHSPTPPPHHSTAMADKSKVQELAERKRKAYEDKRAAEQAAKRQKQLSGLAAEEEEEEAGALLGAQTERQRQAAERASRGHELMPLQEESDPEDLVENDNDRAFIDDEGVEPLDEGGYASDGEQRELAAHALWCMACWESTWCSNYDHPARA